MANIPTPADTTTIVTIVTISGRLGGRSRWPGWLPALLVLWLGLSGCSTLLFFPQPGLRHTPQVVGLDYRDVYFDSLDGTRLHGWWLPSSVDAPALGTVLLYHGNAQNIASHLASVYWLPKRGFNVFLFDYRGYGLSAGKPSLKGVHGDGVAALNQAVTLAKADGTRVVVLGQSIGGTIAVRSVVSRGESGAPNVAGLALDSTFASYRKITREKLGQIIFTWPLQWPLSFLMPERYSAGRVVDRIAIPLLIMHGDADRTVPMHHGQDLYRLAVPPKQFVRIAGGRHIEGLGMKDGRYRDRLVTFFRGVLGYPPEPLKVLVDLPVAPSTDVPEPM